MGLDVSYYSKLKKCQKKEDDEEEYRYYEVGTEYNNSAHQYQLGSLKGVYSVSESSVSGHIACGSYGSYNSWRNELAIMAGYGDANNVWQDTSFSPWLPYINLRYLKLKKLKGEEVIGEQSSIKPFYELIHFSDCEGTIGPEVSKKLYNDFVEFDQKAKEYNTDNDYFYRKYKEWKEAFRIASKGGAVTFH